MKRVIDRLHRLFKFRFAILYPVGVYVAVFCVSDDQSLWQGGLIMLAGMAIRVWANSYAIKMDRLTTSGPYAFVRNPLYVGTALIVVGIVVLLRIYLLGALFLAIMAFVYRRTIKEEQRMLTEKFGDAFRDYMKNVPAMFPRLTPYPKGEKWPPSWQRLFESREHKVVIWMVVLVIAFHLKEEHFVEKELLDAKMVALIVGACLLGLVDLFADLFRHNIKKGAAK